MTFNGFHTFSLQHIVTLAVMAILCLLLAWITRRLRIPVRKQVGRAIGCLLIGYTIVFYVQQYMAGYLSWEYSLPIELCNLVLLACILAMFRPGRLRNEITYFWGLGGTTQALITPDLAYGFPSWDFILFFWSHGALMLGIVFLITGTDFQPNRRSIFRMMIALNAYAIVIGAVDWIMGWNYGYLCRKPAVPSLLDYLGSWPWYLASLEGVALLSFLLLYWGHNIFYRNTAVSRFQPNNFNRKRETDNGKL